VPSAQKVISVSDSDAAFHRQGRLGHGGGLSSATGPQRQGFVSALIVPRGNAADNGQLVDVVLDHWDRTQVLPGLVSSDDGYSDQSAREDLLAAGVKVVSISGARGKKITGTKSGTGPITARRETTDPRSSR